MTGFIGMLGLAFVFGGAWWMHPGAALVVAGMFLVNIGHTLHHKKLVDAAVAAKTTPTEDRTLN